MIVSVHATGSALGAIPARSKDRRICRLCVVPGKPMQSGWAEGAGGRMRNAPLTENSSLGLDHARNATAGWMEDGNTARPRSSRGGHTPSDLRRDSPRKRSRCHAAVSRASLPAPRRRRWRRALIARFHSGRDRAMRANPRREPDATCAIGTAIEAASAAIRAKGNVAAPEYLVLPVCARVIPVAMIAGPLQRGPHDTARPHPGGIAPARPPRHKPPQSDVCR
ncbi:MAG: transposase [Alphaproteobacteria bacterium]|nr:transposase [Alphaproteobacteria bacterium]